MPGCTIAYGEGAPGPHALTSVTCNGLRRDYGYDAKGNLTTYADARTSVTVSYTSFNKSSSMQSSDGRVDFRYDASAEIEASDRSRQGGVHRTDTII